MARQAMGGTSLPARDRPLRRLELRPRAPFRLDLTVWALRRRDQNRIDTWDGTSYRRALLIEGQALELAVRQLEPKSRPRLEVTLMGPHVSDAVEAAARSALATLLGLDVDLSGFYKRVAHDGPLADLAERYRGVKPPRFPSIFECLLNAVACQQLSLAAGLTLLSRLAMTAGASAGGLHTFPEPSDVLRLRRSTLRELGFSERKGATIRELASGASTGELELSALEQLDDRAVGEALVRHRGIGPWSADYVLLRGLGRLHVFPRGDVGALNGLRRFLAVAGVETAPETALARWAPDAGLAYFHLLLLGLEQRAARSGSQQSGWTPAAHRTEHESAEPFRARSL